MRLLRSPASAKPYDPRSEAWWEELPKSCGHHQAFNQWTFFIPAFVGASGWRGVDDFNADN